MNQAVVVKSASEKLEAKVVSDKVIVGFDGFIDEIIHVVAERTDDSNYTRIETIKDFSSKVAAASGLSANVEFVPQQVKLGGNGPILANALLAQGYKADYIGALGKGNVNSVYKEFSEKCSKVISLTDPGHTDALEFNDGKLMLAKMNNLVDVNWEELLKYSSVDELINLTKEAKLLAFTNWTELPNFNSLLEGFNNEVLSKVDHRPYVFIDLADPAKRTDEDVLKVITLIKDLERNANVIFGLNENESLTIARLCGIDEDDFVKRAVEIRKQLDLHTVVIHPIAGAAVASRNGDVGWVDGPYTKTPKLTTGAGDNFNSGFCNGMLSGLNGVEACAVGVCTSGFYVRNCHSPSKQELVGFMSQWADLDCGDI